MNLQTKPVKAKRRFVCPWLHYLYDVCIGPAFMRLIVFCVLEQHFVHVGAGVLKQLVGVVEDDEGNLTVTQHTQLVGLFHQAKLALGERHLPEKEGTDEDGTDNRRDAEQKHRTQSRRGSNI